MAAVGRKDTTSMELLHSIVGKDQHRLAIQLERTRHIRRTRFIRTLVMALLPVAIVFSFLPDLLFNQKIIIKHEEILLVAYIACAALIFYATPTYLPNRLTGPSLIMVSILFIVFSAYPDNSSDLYFFIIPVIIAGAFMSMRMAFLSAVFVTALALAMAIILPDFREQNLNNHIAFLFISNAVVVLSTHFRQMVERDSIEQLNQQLSNYFDLFESAFNGYVLHDGKAVIAANDAFESTFGYSPKELSGQPLGVLFPSADAKILRGEMDDDGPTLVQRLTGRTQSGSPCIVEFAARRIEVLDESMYLVAVRDISAQVEAERTQIEESVEAETVNLLRRFVDAASHDFRTPLSVLNLSLYRLKNSLDEHHHRQLDIMSIQVDRLTQLVDDMLTMTKLDAIHVVSLSWININRLLREQLPKWEERAKPRQQKIHLETAAPITRVIGNEEHLVTALNKLVENAIQYSDKGSEIHIKSGEDAEYVKISVIDQGYGIDPQFLPKIFERLSRADSARNTETGGSGLGLPIAQRIAHLHDGSITVESALQAGSTFTLCLPRPDAHTSTDKHRQAQTPS